LVNKSSLAGTKQKQALQSKHIQLFRDKQKQKLRTKKVRF